MNNIKRIIAFIMVLIVIQLAACKKDNEEFAIASFSYSGDTTLAPTKIKFENTGFGADAFYWKFDTLGISEEENPSFEFDKIGIFRVTLRVTGPANVDSISKSITIGAQASPTAKFSLGAPLLASTPIRFSNTSINANEFLWEFGDGSTSTAFSPEHTYSEAGSYQVLLTATNNLNGESSTYSQIVEVVIPTKVTSLFCQNVIHEGNIAPGSSNVNIISTIPYEGGNGSPYSAMSLNSTGVVGLIASLEAGILEDGIGTLLWRISGLAQNTGIASFLIEFGGQSCNLELEIVDFPSGYVNCDEPTEVREVISLTGKTWMDRNLGASRSAISSSDAQSYGDLFQWGRGADGHQCRNSGNIFALSSLNNPGHDDFIIPQDVPWDWRNPQNDNLWQGLNGINNPCPNGFRLPTWAEWDEELSSWSSVNAAGAISSPLKLPLAGLRIDATGEILEEGDLGCYWSSTTTNENSDLLVIDDNSFVGSWYRASGYSVRCIKD